MMMMKKEKNRLGSFSFVQEVIHGTEIPKVTNTKIDNMVLSLVHLLIEINYITNFESITIKKESWINPTSVINFAVC